MRKLYWKIFFWIWFTMIVVIGGTVFTSNYFLKERMVPLRNSAFLSAYATAAVMAYESEGMSGLQFWLDQLIQDTGIQAFLITDEGSNVTQDTMNNQMEMVRNQVTNNLLPNAAFREDNILVSKSITAQNGMTYRLLTNVPNSGSYFSNTPIPLFWMRFIFAMLISGLICYMLSRYLASPILKLKHAASRFGAGLLSTRVGNKIGHRNDEIAELAREFDRMAEQIETLIETQKRLLRDVSHELRSPLARLQVALELARRRTEGLAENELDRIELESQRLNELIGEILSLVRLDAAEIVLEDRIDITQLLKDIVKDTNYEFKQLGTAAVVKWEQAYHMRGNRTLLQRAFENIIRNDLRYTKTGTIVEIDIQKISKPKPILLITIADCGPGVPEADLPHLFKPFYRVESSRKNDTGGYGIGLAIADKAIKLHAGTVVASNRSVGGLVVEIQLPAQE
jgi:two-component system sensor histidine kinase CpxA